MICPLSESCTGKAMKMRSAALSRPKVCCVPPEIKSLRVWKDPMNPKPREVFVSSTSVEGLLAVIVTLLEIDPESEVEKTRRSRSYGVR